MLKKPCCGVGIWFDLEAKAWWGAWWWRTGQSRGCASRRRSRWQLARWGRSGGRADLRWRWRGGIGGKIVVRWRWQCHVHRSASLSVGCGRLFFHSCKVDASTLKWKTERFCYDLLIGQNPNIFTANRWGECVPAETELLFKYSTNYGPDQSSWRS